MERCSTVLYGINLAPLESRRLNLAPMGLDPAIHQKENLLGSAKAFHLVRLRGRCVTNFARTEITGASPVMTSGRSLSIHQFPVVYYVFRQQKTRHRRVIHAPAAARLLCKASAQQESLAHTNINRQAGIGGLHPHLVQSLESEPSMEIARHNRAMAPVHAGMQLNRWP